MRHLRSTRLHDILILLLLLSCKLDHGLAPLPGKLTVEVIFWDEAVPEDTEGVYLFVAPEFPPHAINELFLSPNSIPLDNDTVYAEIDLPYGRYEAVGLWWYNRKTESNLADVLTIKLNAEDFMPAVFHITPEEPHQEIRLYGDLFSVDRDAAIEGTITFNGPFPENTLATAIGAYVQKPERSIDYLIYLKSMDFSVDTNPFHYRLPVESSGSVRYLAVFWLSDRAGLGDFKTVGFYEDPANPGQPGAIQLQKDQTITGIDIDCDWSRIVE